MHSAASDTDQILIVTVWGLGQTAGPLVLSPLSEMYGRVPIYHISTVLFILLSIAGALSVDISMIIAIRLLMGLVTISPALNPPIVGDLFVPAERGRAMAVVSIAPLLGTVFGPAMGGYLTQTLGWRWLFWIVAILASAFEVTLMLTFRETYRAKILRHKAKRLKELGDNSVLHPDYNVTQSTRKLFGTAILRPMQILVLCPAVTLLSVYVAIVYGYIYLLAATMTEMYEEVYHFTAGPAGLTYAGIGSHTPVSLNHTFPCLENRYTYIWQALVCSWASSFAGQQWTASSADK